MKFSKIIENRSETVNSQSFDILRKYEGKDLPEDERIHAIKLRGYSLGLLEAAKYLKEHGL